MDVKAASSSFPMIAPSAPWAYTGAQITGIRWIVDGGTVELFRFHDASGGKLCCQRLHARRRSAASGCIGDPWREQAGSAIGEGGGVRRRSGRA